MKSGIGVADCTCIVLLNLTPSDVVIPISYGSPEFQRKGIMTLASDNLCNIFDGSIAALVFYH